MVSSTGAAMLCVCGPSHSPPEPFQAATATCRNCYLAQQAPACGCCQERFRWRVAGAAHSALWRLQYLLFLCPLLATGATHIDLSTASPSLLFPWIEKRKCGRQACDRCLARAVLTHGWTPGLSGILGPSSHTEWNPRWTGRRSGRQAGFSSPLLCK